MSLSSIVKTCVAIVPTVNPVDADAIEKVIVSEVIENAYRQLFSTRFEEAYDRIPRISMNHVV